ncbi:Metallo-dependent hydrolase [Cadophora sp. DSE1049]|nr:Metallo-dependent hydrolase [Cadophora sp. DSE1049]
MPSSILLQGGTVLVHDENEHVNPIKADILIEGNTISEIGAGIKPGSGVQVIDCTDKMLSPGFVDTHHHVWQTLLKGRHGNDLLLDYFGHGNFTNSIHSPEDLFWGQLAGCLECLEAGTTTVVDHAHLNSSPDATKAAIAATISSGIRSVFCYCPSGRVESWKPFTLAQKQMVPWVVALLDELAAKSPFGDGRVSLGFAFDDLYLPKDVLAEIYGHVKSLGISVNTVHYVRNAITGTSSLIEKLDSYGLLDSSFLFSHATNATPADATLLAKTNSHVSTTPSTELQMAQGASTAFHPTLDITSQCGVGVDCHSNQSASIPSELRLLLQSSRATYNQKFVDEGKVPKKLNRTVEEAFNLGTLGGARAAKMEGKIGTLKVGAFADILVWDSLSPGMVCAAQHDPVSAIVLHSSPQDIEMVIVDGVVRKDGGKLKGVDVDAGRGMWGGVERGVLQWKDVSRELVARREVLQKKIEGIDMEEARKGVIAAFHIDESLIVDSV